MLTTSWTFLIGLLFLHAVDLVYRYGGVKIMASKITKHWKVYKHIEAETNGRHFADIFKCIFFSENVWIPIKISLKCVPKGQIDNIPAMVQIMVWRR